MLYQRILPLLDFFLVLFAASSRFLFFFFAFQPHFFLNPPFLLSRMSDAPVLFAGDLLEESAPPYFGDGFPLSWPDTVGRLLHLGAAILVPGHGDVMTPADAQTQHEELAAVAAACHSGLAEGGFEASAGPFPEDTMRAAWERANLESAGPQPPGARRVRVLPRCMSSKRFR